MSQLSLDIPGRPASQAGERQPWVGAVHAPSPPGARGVTDPSPQLKPSRPAMARSPTGAGPDGEAMGAVERITRLPYEAPRRRARSGQTPRSARGYAPSLRSPPVAPLAETGCGLPVQEPALGSSTSASGVMTGATVRKNALSGPKGELHRALTSQQGTGQAAVRPQGPVWPSQNAARSVRDIGRLADTCLMLDTTPRSSRRLASANRPVPGPLHPPAYPSAMS